MILGHEIHRGQTKVGEEYLGSAFGNQDILRLEIAMVDTQSMAVLHGIQDLEKDAANEGLVTYIPTLFRNVGEEVPFGTVLQDYVGAVWVVDNLEHRHHVGMCGCRVMEADFALLKVLLATVQGKAMGGFAERLDGIASAGVVVKGFVDDTVRSGSQDGLQLERVAQVSSEARFGGDGRNGPKARSFSRRCSWRSQGRLVTRIMHGPVLAEGELVRQDVL